jgi:hypothetical protein
MTPRRRLHARAAQAWLFFILAGCTSPIVAARLRVDTDDAGSEASMTDPSPPSLSFGEASFSDTNDEPPFISDPVDSGGDDFDAVADADADI